MKIFLSIFHVGLLVSACSTLDATTPTPTPVQLRDLPHTTATQACIPAEPTQSDIERVRSFAQAVMEPEAWQQSTATSEGYVAVTWQNIPLSALIHLEARIKPCGYTDADLDADFSDENWGLILRNYGSHELGAACRTGDGLRLYQFKAQNQGIAYSIKYWVRSDTRYRVITAMFVFPSGSESVLEGYAARLFPDLTSCSRE